MNKKTLIGGIAGVAILGGVMLSGGEKDFKTCGGWQGRIPSPEAVSYKFAGCAEEFTITKEYINSLVGDRYEKELKAALEIYERTGLEEVIEIDEQGNIKHVGTKDPYEEINF